MPGVRPAVAADSEVYKMLQENQESDEPPRQSASFKVLQEILETGMHRSYSQLPPIMRDFSFSVGHRLFEISILSVLFSKTIFQYV